MSRGAVLPATTKVGRQRVDAIACAFNLIQRVGGVVWIVEMRRFQVFDSGANLVDRIIRLGCGLWRAQRRQAEQRPIDRRREGLQRRGGVAVKRGVQRCGQRVKVGLQLLHQAQALLLSLQLGSDQG